MASGADTHTHTHTHADTRTKTISRNQARAWFKKVFLCGKTLVEEIFSYDDSSPEQCRGNCTLWITFDRHLLQMTDKTVLEHGEELSN